MDSMRRQGGIQMLLSAEQEAQQIVSSAKNMKTSRLRQAKEEAEREVAQYRSDMEADHQKKLSERSGSSSITVKRLEEETEKKIKELKKSGGKVSPDVVAMLVNHIKTIKN